MPNARRSAVSKVIYRWVRDLHLYFGLFISPFALIYAVSAVFFNHAWTPWRGATARMRSATVVIPQEDDNIQFAKALMKQVGVIGEIEFVRREQEEKRVVIPVVQPGKRTTIRLALQTRIAEIEERDTGLWDAFTYLHLMPGQHLAQIRGNWFFMKLWRWLADTTVYLVLFVSASGIYLWTVLKAERKVGLICLGVGLISFIVALIVVLA